jgi:hypothetical protein
LHLQNNNSNKNSSWIHLQNTTVGFVISSTEQLNSAQLSSCPAQQ